MSTSSAYPTPVSTPPPPPRRPGRRFLMVSALVGSSALVGGIIGGASGHTTVKTVTVTQKVPVPGPTVTQTEQVPAPPPPAGSVLNTFAGRGNQVTPQFTTPDSGDYVVKWSYSGNVDSSFGNSTPANFVIQETGSGLAIGLPNDIAASGSGSTEVTGSGDSDSLNVQAQGSWSITIVSAP